MYLLYKIPVILFLLCTAGTLWGQLPDYYSGNTVTANGNIYKIKSDGLLRIQNVNNYKMDHPYNSKGKAVPYYQLRLDPITQNLVFELVKSVFTKEEIGALIKENPTSILYFGFIVDDRTGKVLEVSFVFKDTPLIRTIKPDKLSYLEQRLKEIVTYPHDPGSVREFHTGTGINIYLDKLYESY